VHVLGNPCVGANKPNRHCLPPCLPPRSFLSINSYTTPTLCHQHRNISPLRSQDSHATSPIALDCTGVHINSCSHSCLHSCPISHTHTQVLSHTRTCTQLACNHMHPHTHTIHTASDVPRHQSRSHVLVCSVDNPKLTSNDMYPCPHHSRCVEPATSLITFTCTGMYNPRLVFDKRCCTRNQLPPFHCMQREAGPMDTKQYTASSFASLKSLVRHIFLMLAVCGLSNAVCILFNTVRILFTTDLYG